ncbi:MAG TPA: pyridoxal phosphate-dependent aminotransferase [Candidatus Poseidoniales archaeon]|nr:MAG: pyridoxal phosphate-dependent aminotransferase [Euryarchaeota archaeon]HIG38531.1 pyridoxal phosphate-dependent aminotransferase [Candidatus Poseidoniales archaeon]HIL44556.1 pyridoxal phosphate-dependent aminotransferase [Candidatus Poseidoniales archaeon]
MARDGAFREVPYMGVIWVVAEAHKRGFWNGNPDWCNLGQGQPEIGEMEGAPERLRSVVIEPEDQAYGPINGTDEMRQAVADHYNRYYRRGKRLYTAANVGIAQGGRLMLSRVFGAVQGRMGYQIPDYTAYQDMMDYASSRLDPVLIATSEENNFSIPAVEFVEAAKGLDSFLVSNPCNPTGHVIQGGELESYCETARNEGCTLIMDEFYSHFIYEGDQPGCGPVSCAQFVDNPDTDPILVIDGLTKSFRYPGWRMGWVLGPPEIIETLGRVASAIDGGPSRVSQRMALRALESSYADQETGALREVFVKKRNMMVERLTKMGMRCLPGAATFYIWACVESLPEPLNDGMGLFWAALDRKVMTVPGEFFDVNPGGERGGESPFRQWVRFSFGPPHDNVDLGLTRLEELFREHGVDC